MRGISSGSAMLTILFGQQRRKKEKVLIFGGGWGWGGNRQETSNGQYS